MYFSDLSPCRYTDGSLGADFWQAPLLAVGWLESPHEVPQGALPPELVPRLAAMIEVASRLFRHETFRGRHDCSLCAQDFLPDSEYNLLIPGDGVVYAVPAGILHYIRDHGYQPPLAFIVAALACPEYGSAAFFEVLQAANGGERPPLVTDEALKRRREAGERIRDILYRRLR